MYLENHNTVKPLHHVTRQRRKSVFVDLSIRQIHFKELLRNISSTMDLKAPNHVTGDHIQEQHQNRQVGYPTEADARLLLRLERTANCIHDNIQLTVR